MQVDLRSQIEAAARRLGCDVGEHTLEFRIRDGHLVQTYLHHGPVRNEELARLSLGGDPVGDHTSSAVEPGTDDHARAPR